MKRKRLYNRILSIMLVLLLVSIPVFNPALFGQETEAHAISGSSAMTYIQAMNPAYTAQFVAWLLVELASMGIAFANLSELLTYTNNTDFRTLVSDLWDEYCLDHPATGLYFNSLGWAWSSIAESTWAGLKDTVNNIFPRTVNVSQEKLVDSGYEIMYNKGQKYMLYENTYAPPATITNWNSSTYLYTYEYLLANKTYKFNDDEYKINTIYDSGWKYQLTRNGTVLYTSSAQSGYYDFSMIPMVSWINDNGAANPDGAVYKLYFYPIGLIGSAAGITSHYNFTRYITGDNVYDTWIYSISEPSVNEMILGHEIEDSDTDSMNVYYPADKIAQLISLLEGELGEQDADDVDLPTPTNTYVETNNTYITNISNEYVQEQAPAIPDTDVADVALELPSIPGDWEMPGTTLLTKFPFCIPFDLYRSFTMFQADAEIPEFTIPFGITSIGYSTNIVIDLEPYQGLVNMARWFLLAMFIVGLIMATRGLIKG